MSKLTSLGHGLHPGSPQSHIKISCEDYPSPGDILDELLNENGRHMIGRVQFFLFFTKIKISVFS
jgi:hypothetical protein